MERGTAEWAAQDSRLGQSPTGCIDQDPREGQNLAVGDCDWTSKRAWTGRVYRVDGLEGTGEYRMGRWNGRDWVWVLKTRAGCRAAASVSKSGLASGASRSPRQSSPAVLTNFDLSSEREGMREHEVVAGRSNGECGHQQAWLRQIRKRRGNLIALRQEPLIVA